jgi:hypothetical protein
VARRNPNSYHYSALLISCSLTFETLEHLLLLVQKNQFNLPFKALLRKTNAMVGLVGMFNGESQRENSPFFCVNRG